MIDIAPPATKRLLIQKKKYLFNHIKEVVIVISNDSAFRP